MFHSKIKIPYYRKNGDKIDINWLLEEYDMG